MLYVHPVVGTLAAVLLVWVALQGYRSRHKRAYAPTARAAHRRVAFSMFVLVAGVAVAGTGSTVLLRPELKVGSSVHFWLQWGVVALLAAAWWLSRRLPGDASARRIHPWLGLAAAIGGALGATLGLGLLP